MRQSLKEWCLEHSRQDLLEQWDYEKNVLVSPEMIGPKVTKSAYWKCNKGHSWKAAISSRTSGTGCPYCSGRFAIPGENDLVTTHPAVAKEWHPTANGELLPRNVKAGTHRKVWWLCPTCGHEWEAVVSSRSLNGNGCPECGKKKISKSRTMPKGGESLLEKYPQLAEEWDYEENGTLSPKDVKARSSLQVHWKCNKGHRWKASLGNRTGGRGCPVCGNKRIEAGVNDLATVNPKLAAEWHPTKNGEMTPRDIAPSSNKRAWWLCSVCGHEWSATVNNRVKRGCPRCNAVLQVSFPEKAIAHYLRIAGFEIIENYRPKWMERKELDIYIPALRVAIEYDGEVWHGRGRKDLNKDLLCLANGVGLIRVREPNCPPIVGIGPCYTLPDRKEESLNSAIEFIFDALCEEYGAEMRESIQVDVRKSRTEIYELMELGRKSDSIAVSHSHLLTEWNPTKNGELTPEMLTKGSDRVVWWLCKNGHTWDDTVAHRVSGRGCPVCSGKRVIAGENDIATLYPELMQDWDWFRNEGIDPERHGKSSAQQVWWLCRTCGHSWKRSITARVKGSKCPNCTKK